MEHNYDNWSKLGMGGQNISGRECEKVSGSREAGVRVRWKLIIRYWILDIRFSEYPIINIQCPIINFPNDEMQHAE